MYSNISELMSANKEKIIYDCFFKEILIHPRLCVKTEINETLGTKNIYFSDDRDDYEIKITYNKDCQKWQYELYKNETPVVGEDNIIMTFAELNINRHLSN